MMEHCRAGPACYSVGQWTNLFYSVVSASIHTLSGLSSFYNLLEPIPAKICPAEKQDPSLPASVEGASTLYHRDFKC